jgi:uncharacterized membrane protein HdeD (DUF308 family)
MDGLTPTRPMSVLLSDLHDLCRGWYWFLLLGIALIVLGAIALGATWAATLAVVLVVGWLLVLGGIVQVAHAFWARQWGGFFLQSFIGVLQTVVGFFVLGHPAASAAGLTMLLAVAFFVGGVFRVAVALTTRFEGWGWLLLGGALNLLMGMIILAEWPFSGLWVLGLFLGVDLLVNGVWFVSLGLAARRACNRLPTPTV